MTFMPSLDATPAFLDSSPDFYTKVRDIGNLKKFSHLLAHCIILSKFSSAFYRNTSLAWGNKIFANAESALEWFYYLLFIGCKPQHHLNSTRSICSCRKGEWLDNSPGQIFLTNCSSVIAVSFFNPWEKGYVVSCLYTCRRIHVTFWNDVYSIFKILSCLIISSLSFSLCPPPHPQ